MKKALVTVACALTVITTLSFATGNTRLAGFGGVDVVSAATPTTPTTPVKPSTPTTSGSLTTLNITHIITFGSNRDDVKCLQNSLNIIGYKLSADGQFGRLTETAVKDYQVKHTLIADGIVGRITAVSLNAKIAQLKPTTPVKPSTPTTNVSLTTLNIAHIITFGSSMYDVKCLQNSLNIIGYKLSADGQFGRLTETAVKDYQVKHTLIADGIVGRITAVSLNAKITQLKGTTPTVPVTPVPPVTPVTPKSIKVYKGLGNNVAFRNGPGADSTKTPVYSFTIGMADVEFDADGRILSAYIDAYEVATPNYDGASMPHFSGWPNIAGYNITDHTTGEVTGVSTNTPESAAAEVSAWKTKRERGDTYGMSATNDWYKQMNFYQKFFVGKTIPELETWFAKNTTAAGRPIKANTVKQDEIDKLAKLTVKEKADLADVVSGATMSLKDAHGDFIAVLKDAYNNRVEVVIPVK